MKPSTLCALLFVFPAAKLYADIYLVWEHPLVDEGGSPIEASALRYRLQWSRDGGTYNYVMSGSKVLELEDTEYKLMEDVGGDCVYITATAWHIVRQLESRPSEPFVYCPADYLGVEPPPTGGGGGAPTEPEEPEVIVYPPDPVSGMGVEVR